VSGASEHGDDSKDCYVGGQDTEANRGDDGEAQDEGH
jgi:hypothetical protein